jgi:hypothetical protein
MDTFGLAACQQETAPVSVKLMSIVWEIDLPPGEKLVLLALADQANDEGRQCWPSVATIARKSGQGERTVRRALDHLEKADHLTRDHRDGNSTQYHIHPCQNGSPAKSAPLPKTTKTPAKLAGKPSRNTKPQKASPSSGTPSRVPSNFSPVMKAGSITEKTVAGWPPGRLEEEIEHFIDRHTSVGTLSQCWQASWRTWVKFSKKWEPRNGHGNGQSLVGQGLRGSRPDPALDLGRYADRLAQEEAAIGNREADFGAGASLPSYLTG